MWIDMQNINNLNTQQQIVLGILILWELIWKGIALYKAARNKQDFWFILLLLLNTAGILPILYIRYFQNDRNIKHTKKVQYA